MEIANVFTVECELGMEHEGFRIRETQIGPQLGADLIGSSHRIGRMPIRLLGDAVLRRRAWELADRLGWASTYNAEYVALTQLQADAFVTLDAELARSVEGIVATASIDALR